MHTISKLLQNLSELNTRIFTYSVANGEHEAIILIYETDINETCSFIHQLKDPESLKSHVQELFPDQVKRKIVITYMLFAGWEVRIVKNCDLGLEDTPQFSKRTYLTIPG